MVSVTGIYGRNTLIFEVDLHTEDMAAVIGRGGLTITALETILVAVNHHGSKQDGQEPFRKRLAVETYAIPVSAVPTRQTR